MLPAVAPHLLVMSLSCADCRITIPTVTSPPLALTSKRFFGRSKSGGVAVGSQHVSRDGVVAPQQISLSLYIYCVYIYIYSKFPTVRICFIDIYVYGFILTAKGLFFVF